MTPMGGIPVEVVRSNEPEDVVSRRRDRRYGAVVLLAAFQERPDLANARAAGPPGFGASVEDLAPFGLAVLLALAGFAAANSVAWIMDY